MTRKCAAHFSFVCVMTRNYQKAFTRAQYIVWKRKARLRDVIIQPRKSSYRTKTRVLDAIENIVLMQCLLGWTHT